MRSCQGKTQGIAFVDSTPLSVCKNLRAPHYKTFKGKAVRGKLSTGWFYGFKLHLIVNDQGEILSFCVTSGKVDDRKPVPQLAKFLTGKLFGDRGLSILATKLPQSLSTAKTSQSPVSSERLVNLEKKSFSNNQAPKLDGEMMNYLF